MKNKIYENQRGARIEVLETNKDIYGTKYVTFRFNDSDRTLNVKADDFKMMLKANFYKEVK